MTKKRREKFLGLFAICSLIVVGVLGFVRSIGDLEYEIASVLPEGSLTRPIEKGRFIVYTQDLTVPIGYVSIESSGGYGKDLVIAILIDTAGRVVNLNILKHNETPSFMQKVKRKGLIQDLKGTMYSSTFDETEGIDVVTGATYTSLAIIESVKKSSRHIARDELGLEVPAELASTFRLGIPELTLVLLYTIALFGVYTKFKYRKLLRWFTLLSALVILGFWFAVPLTLERINSFLIGFWPDWHVHLYWYILIIGFFLVLLVTRKNIYCSWICPLGCIQDCLGLVGNAKSRFPARVHEISRWIQRGIAWLAMLLAFYFRSPVKINYEIFGVSLSLTGATYLFIMTGIFFIASLFIKRPWCNYLCPITPISELVQSLTGRRKSISSGGVSGD